MHIENPDEFYFRSNVCRVVNRYEEEYDVNIQRGTLFGNPFKTTDGEFDNAMAVIEYEKYIRGKIASGELTRDMLLPLRRQRLGCTCSYKKRCHGEVLAKIVNETFGDKPNIFFG